MATSRKYGKMHIEGIDEDEPVFIIRAQDALAVAAIGAYSEAARTRGSTEEFVLEVRETAKDFTTWRAENPGRVKNPD